MTTTARPCTARAVGPRHEQSSWLPAAEPRRASSPRRRRWFYVRPYSYGVEVRLPYLGQAFLAGWNPLAWIADLRGTGDGWSCWSPWSELREVGEV